MKGGNSIDPLLAPALQMAERPILPNRREADALAHELVGLAERVGAMAHGEADKTGSGQLANAAEAMCVIAIALSAYARGLVPRVANRKPEKSIIVS